MNITLRAFLLAATCFALAGTTGFASGSDGTPDKDFEKRCETVALAIEKDIAGKGLGFLEKYFDYDACLDRTFQDLNAPPRLEREFRGGARERIQDSFGKQLLSATSVKYLRVHRVGQEPRFLFRIAPLEGGVSYFDVVFVGGRGSSVKVGDIFIYALGQNLSDTLRQMVLPLIGEGRRGLLDRLTGRENEFVDHLGEISSMVRAVQDRDYRGAIALYAKLPSSSQADRMLLALQLRASAPVDTKAHQAAIQRWRIAFPDDPSIDLILLNHFVAKEQHDRYFAALDRIENSLGTDPFLDVVRARQCKRIGQFDRAAKLARTAVEREPSLVEGYDFLIALSLQERNFEDTVRWLDEWEKATKTDALRLAEKDSFIEFARSGIGRKWLDEKEAGRKVATKLPSDSAAQPKPKLQGIFYSAAKPSAIISGRTVYPGDRLQGGYRVEQISPREVTLKTPGGELMVLTLQ